MKTINLRGITESLSEREMKLVKGGANVAVPSNPIPAEGGGGGGGDVCIATDSLDSYGNYNSYHCYYGSDAESKAAALGSGANGWWCCNCADAKSWCYSIQ